MNRRDFLEGVFGAAGMAALAPRAPAAGANVTSVDREVGITLGTFGRHLQSGTITLLDLPKLLREELDLRVIDLMTAAMPSLAPDYLEKLRAQGDRAGCVFTNLKMNQPGLEVASVDPALRRRALDEYKRTMKAAAQLGVRWVRPLPGRKQNDQHARLASAYRELIDFGGELGMTILLENVGWMKEEPEAIPAIIKATGPALRSQPDVGNWADAARYEGLAKAFPFAASCDFKVGPLDHEGGHRAYDLRRCFQIGWDAGFRGPWCLEHFHDDFPQLLRDLVSLREQLRAWMRQSEARQR
jgi:hypothetical protein